MLMFHSFFSSFLLLSDTGLAGRVVKQVAQEAFGGGMGAEVVADQQRVQDEAACVTLRLGAAAGLPRAQRHEAYLQFAREYSAHSLGKAR